jgi:hypothetical protein
MPTNSAVTFSMSNEITPLVESLEWGPLQSKEKLKQIVVAAEQLAIAAREPDENVYYIGT